MMGARVIGVGIDGDAGGECGLRIGGNWVGCHVGAGGRLASPEKLDSGASSGGER